MQVCMYIYLLKKTKRKIAFKKNNETDLELVGLPVLYPLVFKYQYFLFILNAECGALK